MSTLFRQYPGNVADHVCMSAVPLRPSGSTARAPVVDLLQRVSLYRRHDLFSLITHHTSYTPAPSLSPSIWQCCGRALSPEKVAHHHIYAMRTSVYAPTSHITSTLAFLLSCVANPEQLYPLPCFFYAHPFVFLLVLTAWNSPFAPVVNPGGRLLVHLGVVCISDEMGLYIFDCTRHLVCSTALNIIS